MGVRDGQQPYGSRDDGRSVAVVEQLARWWTSASQEARFELYKAAIEGDRQAPRLRTLQIAIYLAESEAGEVREG
jgi:hypothetical protein